MTHPSGPVSQTRARVSLTRILVTPYIPQAYLRLFLKRSLHRAHTQAGVPGCLCPRPLPSPPPTGTHRDAPGPQGRASGSGQPDRKDRERTAGAFQRLAARARLRKPSGRSYFPEQRAVYTCSIQRTTPHHGIWGGAHRTWPRASARCLWPARSRLPAGLQESSRATGDTCTPVCTPAGPLAAVGTRVGSRDVSCLSTGSYLSTLHSKTRCGQSAGFYRPS